MPRYFKIPEPITFNLVQPDGSNKEIPMPFERFFNDYLLLDTKFEHPLTAVRQAMKIADAIDKAAKNGQVVELDDKAWDLLRKVVSEPTYKIFTQQGPQVQPGFANLGTRGIIRAMVFIDAIENATTKSPAELAEMAQKLKPVETASA